MSACTSVAPFEANVEFLAENEWTAELEKLMLLKQLTRPNGKLRRCAADSDCAVALNKLHAVYGPLDAKDTLDALLHKSTKVTVWADGDSD